jgi:hypothetical protein
MTSDAASDDIFVRIRALAMEYPDVIQESKFGFPAFFYHHHLFMFCPPASVVLTRLMPTQRVEAEQHYGATAFAHKQKTYDDWCQIPVGTVDELRAIEYLIRTSYQTARLED